MLPATGYAVLGLLSFGKALSGYDLKRWADHSLRFFFWSPAQSAVYTELRRLESLGFVEPVGDIEGPRGRRRYRITDAGQQALTEWVRSTDTPSTVVKDHALLKLWLGHVVDPDTLIGVVEAERKAVDDLLQQIRYSAGRAEDGSLDYAAKLDDVALVERCCERLALARAEAFDELAEALARRSSVDRSAPEWRNAQ